MATERDGTTAIGDRPQPGVPVFDYDFYRDRRFDVEGDFHAALGEMAAETPPIFWSPSLGGHWVIRSHALAFEAARDTALFSSRAMNIPADDSELHRAPAIPINLDPPDHARYRQPLSSLFSPARMARLEGKIRSMAIALIDAIKDEGQCDFVKAVAEPIPVVAFMELVGMDQSRLREFRELAVIGSVDPDPERRKAGAMQVHGIMENFVASRFENAGSGAADLTSELMAATIDGRPVTREEIVGYFRLLFFAGLDTVVNAMAFGIAYLARHQDVQARLRAGEYDLKLAIEELLRLGAPAKLGRYVTRDAEWNGARLKKGDRALLELPMANLDATAFPDPMTFDPGRPSINHLTFNSGPHRCLGQHLARIELRVFYEEWLARIPTFALDPKHPMMTHGGLVMGVDTMPIVWQT